MKSQAYRMALLFDFYGELLTPRQRELFDLYYNEDLSLAEIAEHYGISRQGVRDGIVRAETTLQDWEEKTGLVRRFWRLRAAAEAIEQALDGLNALNDDQFNSLQMDALLRQIRENLNELKE